MYSFQGKIINVIYAGKKIGSFLLQPHFFSPERSKIFSCKSSWVCLKAVCEGMKEIPKLQNFSSDFSSILKLSANEKKL